MTAPTAMPVLSRGSHPSPSQGACVMEYVSVLAGERFSDHPACVHTGLAAVARGVNDHIADPVLLHGLALLAPRFIGTADYETPAGTYAHQRGARTLDAFRLDNTDIELAHWCVTRIDHLLPEALRIPVNAAMRAVRNRLDGTTTATDLHAIEGARYAIAEYQPPTAASGMVYAYGGTFDEHQRVKLTIEPITYLLSAITNPTYGPAPRMGLYNACLSAFYAVAYERGKSALPDMLGGLLDHFDAVTHRADNPAPLQPTDEPVTAPQPAQPAGPGPTDPQQPEKPAESQPEPVAGNYTGLPQWLTTTPVTPFYAMASHVKLTCTNDGNHHLAVTH